MGVGPRSGASCLSGRASINQPSSTNHPVSQTLALHLNHTNSPQPLLPLYSSFPPPPSNMTAPSSHTQGHARVTVSLQVYIPKGAPSTGPTSRTLLIPEHEPVLIGRASLTKNRDPTTNNALFTCAVMSRSHATLSAPNGPFVCIFHSLFLCYLAPNSHVYLLFSILGSSTNNNSRVPSTSKTLTRCMVSMSTVERSIAPRSTPTTTSLLEPKSLVLKVNPCHQTNLPASSSSLC